MAVRPRTTGIRRGPAGIRSSPITTSIPLGAFTIEDLREFKRHAAARAGEVQGRFAWMRRQLLVVVGNLFCPEAGIPVRFRGESAVWFNRDPRGRLLLNVRLFSDSGQPRLVVEDNIFWQTGTDFEDLVCKPRH